MAMAMPELSQGSEELYPQICKPCIDLDRKTKEAHGYCFTCKEHLCADCFKCHRVPSVCRNHVMMDKDSMPKRRLDSRVKATQVRNINVKNKSDKRSCFVTGLYIISHDRMVICDSGNSSLKLVDIKQNKVTSQIRLTPDPWDTAPIPGDSTSHDLIVTMPKVRKLYFFRVTGDTISDRLKDVTVEGRCRGIQVTHSQTIMLCYDDPAKVEILDMNGSVIRRFQRDQSGNQLFRVSFYLAVSPCSESVYVTDWEQNTLTSVRALDGYVMSVLKGLHEPRGMTVDKAGLVFVCCRFPHSLYQVTASGDQAMQILGKDDDLCEYPQAIALSPDDNRMYISGYRSDHVQEFQLEESEN